MSFQSLLALVYDCLFLSVEPRTFYPCHFFFLLYPCDIYRPRGTLCRKSSIKDDWVDRSREEVDCYKKKWQFRWENGNCDEDAMAYPPDVGKFVYASSHSGRPRKKKHDVGRRKIFCSLYSFPSNSECRLTWFSKRIASCGTTYGNYFWPMATIPSVSRLRVTQKQHLRAFFTKCKKYKYN